MEEEAFDFVISKAYKIYLYEKQPNTDEQYLMLKKEFDNNYRKAEMNYKITSDIKYKKQMKMLEKDFRLNVSQTEYEHSKKIIEEYKASYTDVIDESFWDFISLMCIGFKFKLEYETVEEAAYAYKSEIEDMVRTYNNCYM